MQRQKKLSILLSFQIELNIVDIVEGRTVMNEGRMVMALRPVRFFESVFAVSLQRAN